MKRIFVYVKPMLWRIAGGLTVKTIGTVMDLFIPWILAYMIDDVVPQRSVKLIIFWGFIMVICSVCALLGNVIANRMASSTARDITLRIRHDLFSKITHLSCRQSDEFTIPSLISRLSTDTYNTHQMLGMIQRLGVRAPILLLGGIVVTMTLEPVLTLVMLAAIPPLGIIVWFVAKKGIKLYSELQKRIDRMVRTVREDVAGIRVIKALSKSEYEKKRFDSVNIDAAAAENKAKNNMAISSPAMNLFLNLGLTAVIVVGAFRVNAGVSQTGKIIAFMTYFTIILNALLSINRIFTVMSQGTASANRISSVLDAPAECKILPPDHKDTGYFISFENVSFSYSGGARQLKNISFGLKKGQTLGIIGPTGCGKTTLIQLLLRFYDADSGTVRIEGDDIRSVPLEDLRGRFGIAFQNDFIMADSVRENVVFGRDIDERGVRAGLAGAQASEFVDRLDGGIDHRLTARGTNVSGGQRQRILISRALAAYPEILILDDSSSALDYKTDARLRRAVRENYSDTTTIIAAQRVSSIRHADLIIVMDNGAAVGMGTHEELMRDCGEYRLIAESQMGGDIADGGGQG
ncbi:MAG TPA: ABC transporter ATP-binding protein [Candidatus Ornithomonoglobus merdipullorum]|uniref:ABC transporter ATP-binding protein n=1 Tax=Candidatus Ornithomonoglobus merdipullorum TaxID=2840895 RepID=A0A9D1MAW1_9FIRM|nr:ABC transporter ATP-binding protein [Candidatus Ornithomonoglobus merdipullorum]